MEIWKNCPHWLGYAVSNRGRVKSLARVRPHNRHPGKTMLWKEKLLKPISNRRGAFYVVLTGQKCVLIHKLVAEAFIGPCPPGQLIRHLDDDPGHNWADNLAYGTQLDNMADAARNNRIPRGPQRPNWKPKGGHRDGLLI